MRAISFTAFRCWKHIKTWAKSSLISCSDFRDETFSIVSSAKPLRGVKQSLFTFITFLNHCYWVIGTALGGLFGAVISLDFKGLDFVLTALFVTIFVGQWKVQSNRAPAAIGVLCAVACLPLFGEKPLIIPAMLLMIGIITLFQKFLR